MNINPKCILRLAVQSFLVFGLALCACAGSLYADTIKVGLYHGSETKNSYTISAQDGFCVGHVKQDGTFEAHDSFYASNVEISCDGSIISIIADGTVKDAFSNNVVISPLNADGAFTMGGKSYKGFIEFKKQSLGKLSAINHVSTEDYVKGVLPSEFIPSWDTEALKAGAVAVRTYVLKNLGKHDGFDICATVHCQVYNGMKNSTQKADEAVEQTAGMVLCYDGELAETLYCSGAVGHTESADNVWGTDLKRYPYLSGVDLSFVPDEYHTNVIWKKLVTRKELGKAVGLDSVVDIDCEYNHTGYLSSITLYGNDGQTKTAKRSEKVRGLLNGLVPSAKFTVHNVYIPAQSSGTVEVLDSQGITTQSSQNLTLLTADGLVKADGLEEAFLFDGSGRGHGVGMSQYTCQALAAMGYTYDEILYFFYPGTYLYDNFTVQ